MSSGMYESKASGYDIQNDKIAYFNWMFGNNTNRDQLEEAKKVMAWALKNALTPTQRKYIFDYFVYDLNTLEIAEKYGVDKSTVSRTLKRGRKRLWKYVSIPLGRYSEPCPFETYNAHKERLSAYLGKLNRNKSKGASKNGS